ncbi:MAG TPA: nuclear transport factor 2 family protein [Solirubrobacterales bacterium]|nr:nuclear transport factor 2 family protein [Solirubrobacterales bacterium]
MGISDDEKVERITELLTAMNVGALDAAVELSNPDVVLVRAGGGGEVRGTDRIREWMEPDAFESQVTEAVAFEVHGERVLAQVRSTARGAGSGIEIDIGAWTVYSFDDQGRFTRVEIFLQHEENEARRALRAP